MTDQNQTVEMIKQALSDDEAAEIDENWKKATWEEKLRWYNTMAMRPAGILGRGMIDELLGIANHFAALALASAREPGVVALSDSEIVELIIAAYGAGVDKDDDAAIAILRPYLRPALTQESRERLVREMCEAYDWKSAHEAEPADPNAMSAALSALERGMGVA